MKVSLSEYMSAVLSRKLHLLRSWRLQAFAIKETYIEEPYYPIPTADGVGFHNEEGEIQTIAEVTRPPALKPLLPQYTEMKLMKGAIKIAESDIDTTVGGVIVNYIAFERFHPRYKFIPGELNKGMVTTPFLNDVNTGNFDEQWSKDFIDAMSDLDTLFASDSEFMLRSIVEGQLRQDKEHSKLRDKLIEENKDNLEDPLVISKIQGELSKSSADRYAKIGATLWKGGKSHKVTLMKTEGAYGSETGISGDPTQYVTKSLREGVELDKLKSHVEASRYGSYGRGKLTALGGAAVNDAYQALESRKCNMDDCGTKRGAPKRIRDHNYTLFVGQALAGSKAFLTADMLKMYIGKTIYIRTPSKCAAPKDSVCKLCGGRDISRMPDSIPTKASGLMSTVMDLAMQATHGVARNTTRIDFFDDIY